MKVYDAKNHPAKESLRLLRDNMAQNHVDWLLLYYADAHLSEFISNCDDYFEEFSGFTGDSATLLISNDACYLWTDGRYFIQAECELNGSGIILMKDGCPGTPSVYDFLKKQVWEGQRIAFDYKTVSYKAFCSLKEKLSKTIEFVDASLIIKDSLKEKRTRDFNLITHVSDENAGCTVESKLESIRKSVRDYFPDEEASFSYIVSNLPANMWIFNLRGCDIPNVSVAYSYSIITDYSSTIYLSRKNLSDEARFSLNSCGVIVKEYSEFYSDIEEIASDYVLVDDFCNNAAVCEKAKTVSELIFVNDHDLIKKYIKNQTECEGMRKAGIKDGVTMCRFIMKIKELAKTDRLPNEYETGKILDDMRISGGAYSLSFPTICAYGKNAAVVHYEAEQESCSDLKTSGLLLVDSGGHYNNEGTTDITRTISLGVVSDEEKRAYTAVLKGNLRLMSVIFPEGTVGQNIDILARKPIWDIGYNYSHGTGHGVGCNLEVHEAPVRISPSIGKPRANNYPLKPGMTMSDEPGIYVENKFGIRLENVLLVVDKSKDSRKLYGFEPISFAPFDLESIDFNMLDEEDIRILNKYHKLVYDVISPHLDEVAQNWLKDATKSI